MPRGAADSRGRSPLHLACTSSHSKVEAVAKRLLTDAALVHVVDNDGRTPLHACAAHGAEKAALLMIEMGADIDATDGEGNTPLHLSVLSGHEKLVRLLLQHAAMITRNALGHAPRDYAVAKQTHDLLKVEELRQGFEQRYYIVLVYPRKASHHGHDELKTLGPPHSDLVTHDALKQTAKKQTMVHVTDMRPGADMVPSVRR